MNAESHPRKHVSLVVTPEVMLGTLAGLYDVFNCFGALDWFDPSLSRHPPFCVELVSARAAQLPIAGGLALSSTRPVDEVPKTDMIIIPSFMVPGGEWQTGRHPELVNWLERMHDQGAEMCSACSGTLLLAETGLLDGRTATMHWAYAETFRRNFPAVALKLDKVLVTEGERDQFVMSGAASSWHDLSLYLISRHLGSSVAQAVAKFFAFDCHTDGMAPYSVFVPPLNHGDAEIRQVQAWIAEYMACQHPVEEMIRQSRLPERSFKRRFRNATGYAPIRYVQELRINEAKRLLEQSHRGIDDIAHAVGYEDSAFFWRLFKRQVGVTPATHRRKFQLPHSR
ncbi:transcriptional regulator GlxA family with amidase domain [Natronocella acetinitrilica]|uniref:Transcriptional regulator GlxA family with amidase domain n=1 Tax=Natronocella acetinitrilica TaxID=414046 RepID=A0AAE3G8M6_9GAMM|nr:helix-turn-helix domain-containing protein [Natronocella acetinitrilica]MCP1677048.1 transcriptional regulator GlxA family with amidase domain [Natronocella acetinitrilica]